MAHKTSQGPLPLYRPHRQPTGASRRLVHDALAPL